jgi:hypothetical protein
MTWSPDHDRPQGHAPGAAMRDVILVRGRWWGYVWDESHTRTLPNGVRVCRDGSMAYKGFDTEDEAKAWCEQAEPQVMGDRPEL